MDCPMSLWFQEPFPLSQHSCLRQVPLTEFHCLRATKNSTIHTIRGEGAKRTKRMIKTPSNRPR